MDFIAIASRGAYPTPTPTGAVRAALAVSYGLLDFALSPSIVTSQRWRMGMSWGRKLTRMIKVT